MSIAVVVCGRVGDLADRLERLRGPVTIVRHCDELTEVIALAESGLADAALLLGPTADIDAAFADELAFHGVPAVAITDEPEDAERLTGLGLGIEPTTTGEQSVSDLLELLVSGAHRPSRGARHASHPAETSAEPARDPGRVLAVWGPTGSTGKTLVAVNLAAEAAMDGQRVLLVDADTYGSSVAVHLGLLDESAGIAQLCRLSDQGMLDDSGYERSCAVVAVGGTTLRVATGLPRPHRWPELRAGALARVLDFVRRRVDLVVVDVASLLERDEDLTYDTSAPQRNGATLAVLEAAAEIVAVGSADSVGVPRMVKALEDLVEILPEAEPRVVFNRVRRSSVGPSPERALRETWERFGPGPGMAGLLPSDPDAADRALLQGSVLAEVAPDSELRARIAELVSVTVRRRTGLFGRGSGALGASRSAG
ncbi:chromosome partitioning protein [Micrococcaceae bacterium RIT802]|nr:chromosome partitioning protein [Micrococcaceae bacterium RIT 802]